MPLSMLLRKCNVMFAHVCDTGKCVISTYRLPSSSTIDNHHAASFVLLKRKYVAFVLVVTINMRLRLIHFPCVWIPVSYRELIHRMNENGVFNFLAQPTQLFAAFIQFSYFRNGLDEGSFYCGSLLNVYISISIFSAQLSCLCEKHLMFFSWPFFLDFIQSECKKGKLKEINIYAHNIRFKLFYWIYSMKFLINFRFHLNIWWSNEFRVWIGR